MSLPTIIPQPGITELPIVTPYEDDEEEDE